MTIFGLLQRMGEEMFIEPKLPILASDSCARLQRLLLSLALFLSSIPAEAANYTGRGTKHETAFLVHVPDKIAKSKGKKQKHPWLLGFGNDGNSTDVINAMQKGCDANGWILVASGNNKANLSPSQIEPLVLDTIYSAIKTLPVDPNNMYVCGLSAGSTVAHWLVEKYPGSVRGLLVSCGAIDPELLKKLSYPSGKGKCAVFMTNAQDSHNKDMRKDCQLLRAAGWTTRWVEFPVGRELAPPEYFSQNLKWFIIESKVLPKVPAAALPESVESLQKKLAAAEKESGRDYNKIGSLNEQLGDAYLRDKKSAEAEAAFKAALAARQSVAPDSPATADLMKKLGDLCVTHERYTEAAEFLEKAIALYEKGTSKEKLSRALEAYANVLFVCGKTTEANAIYDRLNEMKDSAAHAKSDKESGSRRPTPQAKH
jgi:pimeloyl-ACP methyl ester carboxylesterase